MNRVVRLRTLIRRAELKGTQACLFRWGSERIASASRIANLGKADGKERYVE